MKIVDTIKIEKETIVEKGYQYDFFDDKVFLENGWYKELFGKTFNSQNSLPWKKGIVKITFTSAKNKKVKIRRIFYSGNASGINNSQIGLTVLNYQMAYSLDEPLKIKLSKGSRFLFMWQHPNAMVRLGFKYAIVLGFISILVTIISSCFNFLNL